MSSQPVPTTGEHGDMLVLHPMGTLEPFSMKSNIMNLAKSMHASNNLRKVQLSESMIEKDSRSYN